MILLHTMVLPVSLPIDSLQPKPNVCCEGVHGKPYGTVFNAPGIDHKIGTTGYCPHSMALFLGWHRPYLALFEARGIGIESSSGC